MKKAIEEYGLKDVVQIESKISLDQLRRRIAEATAVIVSSLYDPFCLMPTYAVEVKTPAFVSHNAGVSENIKSRQFTFDPQIEGDLLRSVSLWFESELPTNLIFGHLRLRVPHRSRRNRRMNNGSHLLPAAGRCERRDS